MSKPLPKAVATALKPPSKTFNKIKFNSPQLGCDPEFFFRFKGEIIGAEKFLPKGGLPVSGSEGSKFIIDGVQGELNTQISTCRESVAYIVATSMKHLDDKLKESKTKGITVDFSRAVEISKENLADLQESSRVFGCAPSLNAYKSDKKTLNIEDIDPTEYRIRAAGGHIHLGKNSSTGLDRALTKDYIKTVELLDIICGNTCVLVDRDPLNAERRKVYGRAGEFRLPKHGLEYRTLSNFWLQCAPLLSLAFGLARLAVEINADDNHKTLYEEFTSRVKEKNIRDAINNNDFDLAMDNFKRIEDLLIMVTSGGHHPIYADNMSEFMYFIDKISSDGLGYWFKDDPMTHWKKYAGGEVTRYGFNNFIDAQVKPELAKIKAAEKKAEEEAKKATVPSITKGKLVIEFSDV